MDALNSPLKVTVVLALLVAALYGVSYQQFRHFDVDDPRGLSDSWSYLRMARGDYDVSATHRYRFIVPTLAGWLDAHLQPLVHDDDERLRLSFYVINFLLILGAAVLLLRVLQLLGFDTALSIIGALLFMSSRTVAYSVGTPIVDAAYYFGIAAVLFCTVAARGRLLVPACVFAVFAKETALPLILIPWLEPRLPKRFALFASISALLSMAVARMLVHRHFLRSGQNESADGLIDVFVRHAAGWAENYGGLATPAGLHDLQHSFGLLLPVAFLGAYLHFKHRVFAIPFYFFLLLPISALYLGLSSNAGRMLFTMFPLVVPLALVALAHALGRPGSRQVEQPPV